MKHFFINIFFFIVIIFLGIASLYGVLVPDDVPVRAVDTMQVAAFKSGLALYQGNRQHYYAFSPYSDYLILKEDARSSFFSQEEIEKDRFTTDLHSSHFLDIRNAIFSYFNIVSPSIKYTGEDKEIEYLSEVVDNSLVITRNLKIKTNNPPRILGTTISYLSTDFVYDKTGNLYTYQSEDDKERFASLYNVHLSQKIDESRIKISDDSIVIFNPYLSSVIVVRIKPSQMIYVNRNTRLIEVEESVTTESSVYTTSFKVEIYNNPIEAQKYL